MSRRVRVPVTRQVLEHYAAQVRGAKTNALAFKCKSNDEALRKALKRYLKIRAQFEEDQG